MCLSISVFAYGATGAGKTHTMLGSQNEPGVMYRTMTELFKRMDDAKEEKEFSVAFSYLEVIICLFIYFLFSFSVQNLLILCQSDSQTETK